MVTTTKTNRDISPFPPGSPLPPGGQHRGRPPQSDVPRGICMGLLGLKLPPPQSFTNQAPKFHRQAAASSTLPASIKDKPPDTQKKSPQKKPNFEVQVYQNHQRKIDWRSPPKIWDNDRKWLCPISGLCCGWCHPPAVPAAQGTPEGANNTSASLTASTARHKWKNQQLCIDKLRVTASFMWKPNQKQLILKQFVAKISRTTSNHRGIE